MIRQIAGSLFRNRAERMDSAAITYVETVETVLKGALGERRPKSLAANIAVLSLFTPAMAFIIAGASNEVMAELLDPDLRPQNDPKNWN